MADPKYQLDADGQSPRAKAAIRTAHGNSGAAPDHADAGPSTEPSDGKMPKNPVGGNPPKESAQHGSDVLGSATGAVTRKPVERN